MTTRSIRITFPGSLGHELAARLDMPLTGVRTYALFAHCFTCTKDILAARHIAATLTSLGIAVLRFDFTGLGSSDGEFQNTSFSSNVEDLVRAADHLREHYQAPAIIIGHSLGGAAVLAAAHRLPEAKAIATIGAPSDVSHVLLHDAARPFVTAGVISRAIEAASRTGAAIPAVAVTDTIKLTGASGDVGARVGVRPEMRLVKPPQRLHRNVKGAGRELA